MRFHHPKNKNFSLFQQQQNVLNNNGKKPPASSRREKEKRRERPDRKSESSHDGGESKENQEAQPDPLGELPKDGESKTGQDAKSAALKKRGGEGEDFFPFLSLSRFVRHVETETEMIHLQNVIFHGL